MLGGIGTLIEIALGMELVETKETLDTVIYKYRCKSILPFYEKINEIKAKIVSLLNLPAGIPVNVSIVPLKDGIISTDSLVIVEVPKEGIGKLSNLTATKYGIFRQKPYKNTDEEEISIYESVFVIK